MLEESSYQWDEQRIDNIELIPQDTLDDYFKEDVRRGWTKFHQKYGSGFIAFSFPLFSVNKDVCIIQLSIFCGPLCGGGNTALFKKRKGKWVVVKTYEEWVS